MAEELKITYADLELLYERWEANSVEPPEPYTLRQRITYSADYAFAELKKIRDEKSAPRVQDPVE